MLQLLPPLISGLLATKGQVCGSTWPGTLQPVLQLLSLLHSRGMADVTSYAGVPLLLLGMLRTFCSARSDGAFEVAAIAAQLVWQVAPRHRWGGHTPLLAEAEACLAMPRAAIAFEALVQQPDVNVNLTAGWLRQLRVLWQQRQRALTHCTAMSSASISDHQLLCRAVSNIHSVDKVSGLYGRMCGMITCSAYDVSGAVCYDSDCEL